VTHARLAFQRVALSASLWLEALASTHFDSRMDGVCQVLGRKVQGSVPHGVSCTIERLCTYPRVGVITAEMPPWLLLIDDSSDSPVILAGHFARLGVMA